MDTNNTHENRAHLRASVEEKYTATLPSLKRRAYSADENLRIETHTAAPNYTRTKTLAATAPIANEADPNVTPPADAWDLTGYSGGHGYVVLDAAETVSVQLWARDQQNNKWFLVDSVAGLASYEEFRFANKVRGRKVWLRLISIGTAITDITLRFSPE